MSELFSLRPNFGFKPNLLFVSHHSSHCSDCCGSLKGASLLAQRKTALPTVDDPDGEGRAVHLLLRQLDVQELHRGREVRVLLGVHDDAALDDVAPALHIHPRPVHGQELDPLEVPQPPEEDLKPEGRSPLGPSSPLPVLDQSGAYLGWYGHYGSCVRGRPGWRGR